MENMRSRIDRGDIKLERAEAIKVRVPEKVDTLFKLIHITSRRCVISLQTAQSNSNHRYACTCTKCSTVTMPRSEDNFEGAVRCMHYATKEVVIITAPSHGSFHDRHKVTIPLTLLLPQHLDNVVFRRCWEGV